MSTHTEPMDKCTACLDARDKAAVDFIAVGEGRLFQRPDGHVDYEAPRVDDHKPYPKG